ncbi:MAG: MIP/aquaporin family protein [Clostridium septicum]|uniref:MIP/aquaporin family protein n=1 Tax=Clostridium septicum TaxID=1504 RepID=UPI002588C8BB|nr:MIP/aquaporin family protein [Clostridium septicum]MDU1313568.1 MIP/aquaporin family protein [Clostridium septicum]WLF71098.1 MIP/aquaporin family protein [Clostridium septicum]
MMSFLAELIGTMILVYLGDAVVANVVLKKTKGNNSGWIVITTGWAFAVAIPALIFGATSGAHFNPALTIALAAIGKFAWCEVPMYLLAQMLGGFIGAVLVFIQYYNHFEETEDKDGKLGVFCTGPAIRNGKFNFISEFIATALLVFGILGLGQVDMANGLNTIAVGLLIWALGLSSGGTTGYAMNPARDLAPRIAHAIFPVPGKRDSDWKYAWIPVIAPIVGGLIGALAFTWVF